MKKRISILDAVILWLESFDNRIAFFDLELHSFLYRIRNTRNFQGHDIKGFRTDSNLKNKFSEVIDDLILNKIIQNKNKKYFTVGNKNPDDLDVVCSLYDVGYISYLSAMRYYNFTTKAPRKIDYVVPTRPEWKKIQSELFLRSDESHEELDYEIFVTPYPSNRLKVKSKFLNVHSRSYAYHHNDNGRIARVINEGDLFLEMTRYPDLCGGLEHVVEIYREKAILFLDEIVESTESFGSAIDKSRIGFLIDSYLGVKDSRIVNWRTDSLSRGGSRKMVSSNPYSEVYSEDWCISLNHPIFLGV